MEQNNEYIKTGYVELDKALGGGLKRGEVVAIGARPAMGKTNLVSNILFNCLSNNDIKSIYFSVEIPDKQLNDRFLSILSKVDIKDVTNNNLSETQKEAVLSAKDFLAQKDIIIDDTGILSDEDVLERCEKIKKDKGLDIVVIDYIQLMFSSKVKADVSHRKMEIESIVSALKEVAKKLNVVVIFLTQLSKHCERRANKRPILDDLYAYYVPEQYLDVVLFLYNPDAYDPIQSKGIVELNVAKTTHGQSKVINLRLIKGCMRYESMDCK